MAWFVGDSLPDVSGAYENAASRQTLLYANFLTGFVQLFFKRGKAQTKNEQLRFSHRATKQRGAVYDFSFGGQRLKFIGPYSLEYYDSVKSWNAGYLVVMAKYSHDEALVEEYIDLEPVLDDLQIDKEQFLAPIQKVEVANV